MNGALKLSDMNYSHVDASKYKIMIVKLEVIALNILVNNGNFLFLFFLSIITLFVPFSIAI